MDKTCGTCRVVSHGTYTKRCDYCGYWKPLSDARVMGWCEHDQPLPDYVPPMMILLGRLSDDQVTAYNQFCGAFTPEQSS